MQYVAVRKLEYLIFVNVEIKARKDRGDRYQTVDSRYRIMHYHQLFIFLRFILINTVDNKNAPAECQQPNGCQSYGIRYFVHGAVERYQSALSECPVAIAQKIDYEKQSHASEVAHLEVGTDVFISLDDYAYRKENAEYLGYRI